MTSATTMPSLSGQEVVFKDVTSKDIMFEKVSEASEQNFAKLNYASSVPEITGWFRVEPEDFFVEEQHEFSLSGEGEHLWLWVEKTGENTDWVAGEIANWAGVSKKNVGVAGQKDRHAVTRQWFSVTLPGKPDPDFASWPHPSVKILKHTRHQRKLQKGGLSGNRFVIRLRDLHGNSQTLPAGELQAMLEQRLQFIKSHGVPNYFGEQRFGHNGNNLKNAIRWLVEGKNLRMKPNQRSLYLSAMRSWLFNQYLSKRLVLENWDKYLPGDALNLQGSSRWFVEEDATQIDTLVQRVVEQDLHPTGPLPGDGDVPTFAESAELETALLRTYDDWLQGLKKQRLLADRRALRLLVSSDKYPLKYRWLGSEFDKVSEMPVNSVDLQLEFFLPAGSFATMVLREIVMLQNFAKSEKNA